MHRKHNCEVVPHDQRFSSAEGVKPVPRLSILIPHEASPRIESSRGKAACFENDSALESTILSILENHPSECEVIVSHSGAYSDPYQLGGNEVKLIDVGDGAGLGELLNSGLSQASGAIVHTLLPGCVVEDGWSDAALIHFRNPEISSVSSRLVTSDSKEHDYFSMDANFLPRRSWLHHGRSGEHGVASLCGGFYRRSSLVAASGWLGTPDQSVARESAEAELAMIFRALGLQGVCEPDSMIKAPKRIIEGKLGGYALGHDAGRLAVAFAELLEEARHSDSFASRLGYLAGGLLSPKSVAERLGWVLGSTDRSLVADIRWRLARAQMELASQPQWQTMKTAA